MERIGHSHCVCDDGNVIAVHVLRITIRIQQAIGRDVDL